ncbi:MFS transporter [Gemelliphila palaticanis]|uniref:MFS transporter n=1 Tax=Gemelliphila palaticanis TaxID=81950 RepID=A0ABX2SZX4_9BACL|nr:MFS transporter [Gemella palaticanis]MBF0715920.1 MFS transporter [Gemella palaticanis]NYS47850.1 MFS transporter [Gemella palaticanis]
MNIKKNNIYIIICLILLGSILRTPITGIGTIIGIIKENLNINNTLAGMITTIPLIAFTLISPFAAKFATKKGLEKALFLSILVISFGLALRFYINTYVLFIATFIIGVGIAIGNVLIPVFTKKYYDNRLGVMTGFYTVIMTVTASISAAISYPLSKSNIISENFSLGLALNIWLIVSIIGSIFYFILYRKNNNVENRQHEEGNKVNYNIWKSPKLYSVTMTMGLQSALFYCSVSWFGEIMISKGFTPTEAGILLSVSQFAQFPATFLMPIIADKIKNKLIIPIFISFSYLASIISLILIDNNMMLMILVMIFYALAGGGSFSFVMYLFSSKTNTAEEASKVSGVAQSGGYLLAAIFPPLLGYVKDVSDWNTALIILFVTAIVLFGSMIHCSREGNILK